MYILKKSNETNENSTQIDLFQVFLFLKKIHQNLSSSVHSYTMDKVSFKFEYRVPDLNKNS